MICLSCIDAHLAMLGAAAKSVGARGFERLEGILLGYTEFENDAHIKHLPEAPHARDFPWLVRLLDK